MVDLTMIHLSNHLNAHFITFVYNFFLNISHQSTTSRYQNYIDMYIKAH